ncbi:hypothetical protein NUBL21973_50950 [Klebsiella pneumoniae]|nr:hypothetical protein NUBL21973_50950 [Klebsiella pneumoniae]GKI85676.1 hypothetical protein NUBL21976_50200 [Klebsiella pneumoniae]GKL73336.1 hypothetical protein NUBL21993_49810 [Klebsiella pneumoniae]
MHQLSLEIAYHPFFTWMGKFNRELSAIRAFNQKVLISFTTQFADFTANAVVLKKNVCCKVTVNIALLRCQRIGRFRFH